MHSQQHLPRSHPCRAWRIELSGAKKRDSRANSRRIILLCALFFFLYRPAPTGAATLTSSGGWVAEIGSSDLLFGAGSDLKDGYSSPVAATTLEVSGCADQSEEWEIRIRFGDQIWDNHFSLAAKLTSKGTGEGVIIGGDTFQVITASDTIFLTGQGDQSGITVQYQLTGVSIQILPENYSTTVEFTITP